MEISPVYSLEGLMLKLKLQYFGHLMQSRLIGKDPDAGKDEEGNGTPLQYSCLDNPMDGGTWWAVVHGVAKSQTRLKRLSSSNSITIVMLKTRICYGKKGVTQR